MDQNNISNQTPTKPRKKSSLIRILFRSFLLLMILIFLGAGVVIGGFCYRLMTDLPSTEQLRNFDPPQTSIVYSDDGTEIGRFFIENRIVVPFARIPKRVVDAFLAAEDARFFEHPGIDFLRIIKAFLKNVEAGQIVQGGSTITQQVIKAMLLTPEKTYYRKIQEAVLAYKMDQYLSKEEVLNIYLNKIYLGHGAYGVEAAARAYFDKSISQLDLAETAMIAGMAPAPSRYSPISHPQQARDRKAYVLKRMFELGFIKPEEREKALKEELNLSLRGRQAILAAPDFTEYVRRTLEKKYGADILNKGGLRVYTTVNLPLQSKALEAVNHGVRELDKRQGFRGPLKVVGRREIDGYCKQLSAEYGNTPPANDEILEGVVLSVDRRKSEATFCLGSQRGIVDLADTSWAKKVLPDGQQAKMRRLADSLTPGAVVVVRVIEQDAKTGLYRLALEQDPLVQGALLSLEAGTGHVKAMVGGRDFQASQFNRAIQSRRQPGSSFKPIVYAAAMDSGFTPANVVVDSPMVYDSGPGAPVWKPKNYSGKFNGPTRLRVALAKSINIVTIKLMQQVGVQKVIDIAQSLGITSDLYPNLSLALGSSGVSLEEMVVAYSVFDNLGEKLEPIFITRVLDKTGNVLEVNKTTKKSVLDEDTAYLMVSMLQSVITEGTGQSVAKEFPNIPLAGKTGTTNDCIDAWFIGFSPDYVTGVWVGFDDKKSLGKAETGAKAAAPIWIEFMKELLKDKPVKHFIVPKGIVFAKIDAATGMLASSESGRAIFECFKDGTAPSQSSAPKQDVAGAGLDNFLKDDFGPSESDRSGSSDAEKTVDLESPSPSLGVEH
ncbi:MAG: PBP1A family penicillin-binding protein [Deltaproteobacteria bacterium]|nr:PBP1A family penicillin-binding protein [Deltaproteobacteria bacterium]